MAAVSAQVCTSARWCGLRLRLTIEPVGAVANPRAALAVRGLLLVPDRCGCGCGCGCGAVCECGRGYCNTYQQKYEKSVSWNADEMFLKYRSPSFDIYNRNA